MKDFRIDINTDFKCRHCGSYISTARPLAGVGNRNHCPYCLWSRHLDLFEAGDRLAACKAPMRPVGLTLKNSRNKYARAASGELMLVHLCTDCSKISINRIAADDHSGGDYGSIRGFADGIRWVAEANRGRLGSTCLVMRASISSTGSFMGRRSNRQWMFHPSRWHKHPLVLILVLSDDCSA